MRLTLEQVKTITKGAVRVLEENDGFKLFRFTEEQMELYKQAKPALCAKTFCTSGMRFVFKTDSRTLSLKAVVSRRSSRTYFSFDVFKDGQLVGYLDNFTGVDLPKKYATFPLPLGEVSKTFELGEGIKTITVYLPWNVEVLFEEIAIDDGAFIESIKTDKMLLVYGDSITQGFDALRPSNRYAARIADSLGAEEINKAIGGEVFFPELAETDEDFVPDYITVAYGTNDWSKKPRDTFKTNSKKFYTILSKKYPNTKIFAITPIWRKDHQEYREYGQFEDVINDMQEAVRGLENVYFIKGIDFVPKDENYFADLRLHPNDEGFDYYFKGLNAEIQKKLKE